MSYWLLIPAVLAAAALVGHFFVSYLPEVLERIYTSRDAYGLIVGRADYNDMAEYDLLVDLGEEEAWARASYPLPSAGYVRVRTYWRCFMVTSREVL